MILEQTNWAGKYVKVVYSDATLGKNIRFVKKEEGDIVQAWWRGPNNSCSFYPNRKLSLQIVRPSSDDESWVEQNGLAPLVEY
jgi:hypothetical protein